MYIAIISDLKKGDYIKDLLEKYSFNCNEEISISIYSQIPDVTLILKFDLIFLDIDFNSEITCSIENYLRKELFYRKPTMIFISKRNTCRLKLIRLCPVDYIIEPIDYSKIILCIDEFLRLLQKEKRFFHYRVNRSDCIINVDHIVYMQSNGRKIIMQTRNESIEFYGSLTALMEEECFYNFIRIHQSFWVNPNYILKVEHNRLTLIGNIILPISRNRANNIKEWFKK